MMRCLYFNDAVLIATDDGLRYETILRNFFSKVCKYHALNFRTSLWMQEDATEHVEEVLRSVKPAYIVRLTSVFSSQILMSM